MSKTKYFKMTFDDVPLEQDVYAWMREQAEKLKLTDSEIVAFLVKQCFLNKKKETSL